MRIVEVKGIAVSEVLSVDDYKRENVRVIDLEFLDDLGNYRHYQSWIEGGIDTIIYEN